VDQILNANDVAFLLLKDLLDDLVVIDGFAVSFNLYESSLVDQLSDNVKTGGSPCNVGLADSQHVDGGLVQLDKDTVVDLAKTEQLHNLAGLGSNLVVTTNSDNKGELRLRGNVKVTRLLGFHFQPPLVRLRSQILLDVAFGTSEVFFALLQSYCL